MQPIERLDQLTAHWPTHTLRAYRDNAALLAAELDALGLDATTANRDAAAYAALVVRRKGQQT